MGQRKNIPPPPGLEPLFFKQFSGATTRHVKAEKTLRVATVQKAFRDVSMVVSGNKLFKLNY